MVVLIPKGTRFNTRNKLTNQIIKVLKINKVFSELRKSDLILLFRLNTDGGVSMLCGSTEGIVEEANLTTINIDSFIEMLKDTINGVEIKENTITDSDIELANKLILADIKRMIGTHMVLRLLIPKGTNKAILTGMASDNVLEVLNITDIVMTVKNNTISFITYAELKNNNIILEHMNRPLLYVSNLNDYIRSLMYRAEIEKPVDIKQVFKDNNHKLDTLEDGIYINPVEFAKSTNIVVLMDLGLLEDKTSISNLFKDICSESGNPYIFGQTIVKEKITLIHYINGVSYNMGIRVKDLEKLNIRPINSLDELMELVNSL